jgi:mRNA interferase HicA
MNSKQMKKWLDSRGATFLPAKGSHLKVFLNGRQRLPMHGTAELGKGRGRHQTPTWLEVRT